MFSQSSIFYQLVQRYATRQDGFNPLAMYGIEPAVVIRDAETHRDIERLEKMSDEDKRKLDVCFTIFYHGNMISTRCMYLIRVRSFYSDTLTQRYINC